MPRARKDKGRSYTDNQSNPDWGGFLNLRLSEDEKTAFGTWFNGEMCPVWEMYDEALKSGLKYSCAFDAENVCYIATFTGKLVSSSASRFATSARAGSYVEATALLCYKHFVLADCDWGDYLPKSGTLMSWG